MILVYTGDGKGKTSACVGQTVRALGQGLQVGFLQYMKRDGTSGEQVILRQLLSERFLAGGLGFLRDGERFAEHREAALSVTRRAMDILPELDILVLDEALYALQADVLTRSEVECLISASENRQTHLVLSGRGAPDWLTDRADMVSEVIPRKHPYSQGIPAQRGIDF